MSSLKHTLRKNFGNITTERTLSMEELVERSSTPDDIGVSNEGFIDDVAHLFGDIKRRFKHGRKKSLKVATLYRNYDIIIQRIRSQYGNEVWLDKRRFVLTDVKAKDFAGVFQRDGKGQPDFSNEAINDIVSQIEVSSSEYMKRVDKYLEEIRPLANEIQKGDLTLELYARTLFFVRQGPKGEGSPLPKEFLKPLRLSFGGTVLNNDGFEFFSTPPSTVKPLTKEDVIELSGKVADIVAKCRDVIDDFDMKIQRTGIFSFYEKTLWPGHDRLEEMRNGSNNIGAALRELGNSQSNPAMKALLKVGGSALTDEALADNWEELLDLYFSEESIPYPIQHVKFLEYLSNCLAKYIDRSVR